MNSNNQDGQKTTQELLSMIDKLAFDPNSEWAGMVEPMKRAANCRYREYIRETLAEYQRRGNYVRIYPAKGSDQYDHLF